MLLASLIQQEPLSARYLDHDRLANGLVGARLKTLLASRTVAFVGYSLTGPSSKPWHWR